MAAPRAPPAPSIAIIRFSSPITFLSRSGPRPRRQRRMAGPARRRVVYCTGQYRIHTNVENAMPQRMEIPAVFPDVGSVSGKRVVITGAGRGLGELIAHAFSSAGAKVALVARTESDLKAVADELVGPTLVFCGDVRDADFSEAVADGTG